MAKKFPLSFDEFVITDFHSPDFNPDLLDTSTPKSFVGSVKQQYMSYWQKPSNILKNLNSIDILEPIIPPLIT